MSGLDTRLLKFNFPFQSNVALTASTSDASFPVSNLSNPLRSKVWRSTAATSQFVLIDLKTTEEIDSFVMMFPFEETIAISSTATVKLQANATSDFSGSPAVDVTLTLDEKFNMYTHFFTSDQSFRYWRVSIDDTASATGFVEIGMIYLTKAITLTQSPDIGFSYRLNDTSKQRTTEFNQTYVDVRPLVKEFEFLHSNLSEADFETLQDFYNEVGNTIPIVVSVDSDESLFNDKERFIIYGYMGAGQESKHLQVDFFTTPLRVTETM